MSASTSVIETTSVAGKILHIAPWPGERTYRDNHQDLLTFLAFDHPSLF
jgi:hypothetical protein